jgi:hypothetical protein
MYVLLIRKIDYGLHRDSIVSRKLGGLLRQADCCTFWSRYTLGIELALGARRERSLLVREGVDLTRFAPAQDRLAVPASPGVNVSTLLARGARRKGRAVLANFRLADTMGAAARKRAESALNMNMLARPMRVYEDLAVGRSVGIMTSYATGLKMRHPNAPARRGVGPDRGVDR